MCVRRDGRPGQFQNTIGQVSGVSVVTRQPGQPGELTFRPRIPDSRPGERPRIGDRLYLVTKRQGQDSF